ncbi:MAG: ATP-binding protein [Ignavibacteria bacterium]
MSNPIQNEYHAISSSITCMDKISNDLTALIKRDSTITWAGHRWLGELGLSAKRITGMSIVRLIHTDDQDILSKSLENMNDTPSGIELRFKNHDNLYRRFDCCLVYSANEDLFYFSGRNITCDVSFLSKEAENVIQSMLSISKRLNSTLNIDYLMDAMVEEAIKLTGSEGGYAGLRTTNGMICNKYLLNSKIVDFEYCWSPGTGIPGKLTDDKSSVIINNTDNNSGIPEEIWERFNIKSVAYVAIENSQDEVIGFLSVTNKRNGNGFSESDREKLIAISQSASTAIQNALAHQKNHIAELQLKNLREQLHRLVAHTQISREEERTEISREIHDELGQALTGLKMDISWLDRKLQTQGITDTYIQEKFQAMYSLIKTTITTVRKISSRLRPNIIDYFGIIAAIEWQTQEFQNRTGLECKIIALPKELNIDQNFAIALFRIFQETLTNIVKHANATKVLVSLELYKSNLTLIVKDNGRGITENAISNTMSFGLLGMKERAYLLGGEFEIKADTKGGTIVTTTVPVGNIKDKGRTKK